MTNPRDSLPEPLRAQIEAAAFEFASQIVSAFEQSIVDVTERLAAQSHTGRAQARPASVARPERASGASRAPGGTALERRVERVLAKSDDGLGVEALNRAIGSTTSELTPALQRLMEAGRVGKRGKARGTKYFLT